VVIILGGVVVIKGRLGRLQIINNLSDFLLLLGETRGGTWCLILKIEHIEEVLP